MTSSSALGYMQITLQFSRGQSIDSYAEAVQAAINATAGQLPVNLLNPPIYRGTNPADTPILLIALTSDSLPITKVSDYANSILAQKLSQVPAVGLVSIGGEQNPAIRHLWTCLGKVESSSEGKRSISWASRSDGSGRNLRPKPFGWLR
jgi:multidrug efflux pump subunit AcrB